jgi:hypothetical protein
MPSMAVLWRIEKDVKTVLPERRLKEYKTMVFLLHV